MPNTTDRNRITSSKELKAGSSEFTVMGEKGTALCLWEHYNIPVNAAKVDKE